MLTMQVGHTYQVKLKFVDAAGNPAAAPTIVGSVQTAAPAVTGVVKMIDAVTVQVTPVGAGSCDIYYIGNGGEVATETLVVQPAAPPVTQPIGAANFDESSLVQIS